MIRNSVVSKLLFISQSRFTRIDGVNWNMSRFSYAFLRQKSLDFAWMYNIDIVPLAYPHWKSDNRLAEQQLGR